MKAIHYDAEGDILSVTFAEAGEQAHAGVELTDNIVLYYNPDTEKPLKLILVSYQAMLRASEQSPILLDGLAQAPAKVRKTILYLLQQSPLTTFIQVEEGRAHATPTSRLHEIFAPTTLQSVRAN
ncbi:MAG: hypothetical protein U0350_30730 [Caldilineaceae bacterium]